MKQSRQPRMLTARAYRGIDPEVRALVRLLNRVDGVATLDSCFGHSRDKRHHTNQLHLYVGLHKGHHQKFLDFFAFLLKHTYAGLGMVFLNRDMKIDHLEDGFSLGLQARLYPSEGQIGYELVIHPLLQAKARSEKLKGISFVCRLIREYLKLGPQRAKKKIFGLRESIAMIRRYGFNPGITLQHTWSPTRQVQIEHARARRTRSRARLRAQRKS